MAEFSQRDRWNFLARVGVSVALIVPCLYVILLKQTPSDSVMKWAIGTAGIVIGYWLR